jgi:Restriction endonuclease
MTGPRVTRTSHRLPFGELDPHRFEDLVRELLHRFRTWRSVEGFGRSGADQGVDVRAYEVLLGRPDKLWYGQVKRTAQLGPTDIRRIVEEALPADTETTPDVFLVAAAADLSRPTRDAAEEALSAAGVQEVHFWGRSELEDLLHLPGNDDLLHKYFDLGTSRRREVAIDAYREWLQFTENWATWAYEQGASPEVWRRDLHDRKAALDLVATDEVKSAVQSYIDHLDAGTAAIAETYIEGIDPWAQQDDIAVAFARAMEPFREAMVTAMRDDIGPF